MGQQFSPPPPCGVIQGPDPPSFALFCEDGPSPFPSPLDVFFRIFPLPFSFSGWVARFLCSSCVDTLRSSLLDERKRPPSPLPLPEQEVLVPATFFVERFFLFRRAYQEPVRPVIRLGSVPGMKKISLFSMHRRGGFFFLFSRPPLSFLSPFPPRARESSLPFFPGPFLRVFA